MTWGGTGFGVLEWKDPNEGPVKLAYLQPLPKDVELPSQLDNRRWEFYEIWNAQAWARIGDPWSTPPGDLRSGLIAANAAGRLMLKKIIRVSDDSVHTYIYRLTRTTLRFPECGEQVKIGDSTLGKQLFFSNGWDNIQLRYERYDGGPDGLGDRVSQPLPAL